MGKKIYKNLLKGQLLSKTRLKRVCIAEGCGALARENRKLDFYDLPEPDGEKVKIMGKSGKLETWDRRVFWIHALQIRSVDSPDVNKICAQHFEDNDFIQINDKKKVLKNTAIPSINLPEKNENFIGLENESLKITAIPTLNLSTNEAHKCGDDTAKKPQVNPKDGNSLRGGKIGKKQKKLLNLKKTLPVNCEDYTEKKTILEYRLGNLRRGPKENKKKVFNFNKRKQSPVSCEDYTEEKPILDVGLENLIIEYRTRSSRKRHCAGIVSAPVSCEEQKPEEDKCNDINNQNFEHSESYAHSGEEQELDVDMQVAVGDEDISTNNRDKSEIPSIKLSHEIPTKKTKHNYCKNDNDTTIAEYVKFMVNPVKPEPNFDMPELVSDAEIFAANTEDEANSNQTNDIRPSFNHPTQIPTQKLEYKTINCVNIDKPSTAEDCRLEKSDVEMQDPEGNDEIKIEKEEENVTTENKQPVEANMENSEVVILSNNTSIISEKETEDLSHADESEGANLENFHQKIRSEAQLFSLTGIMSFQILDNIAETVRGHVPGKLEQLKIVPLEDRVLLCLMKMHLRLSFDVISFFFKITPGTAGVVYKEYHKIVMKCVNRFMLIAPTNLNKI